MEGSTFCNFSTEQHALFGTFHRRRGLRLGMRDRLRFRLRAGQDIRFRRGSRSVLHGRLRGCQCAAAGQAVGNGGVIEGNLIRQVKAVLGVPAGTKIILAPCSERCLYNSGKRKS